MQWIRPLEPPLAFESAGHGPPVLFIHGLLGDGTFWAPVATAMQSRYRTLCCHLRGHGRTPPASRRAKLDHVADLESLLDWVGLPSVNIVSHGGGWALGAGLAARAPGRVRSLAVVDPVIPRAERSSAVQEAWHLEMLLQWLSVAHGSVVRRPDHVATLQSVIAQQTHVSMAPEPFQASAAGGPALLGCDVPRLSLLQCPLLTLIGEQSSDEARALVTSLFGQVRHGRTGTVPGAIRHSPREATRVVADLLDQFLSDIA